MSDSHPPTRRVQLGVIGRPHGVRGLVKITSHTADPADVTAYGPLSDAEGRCYTLRWKAAGVAEVCRVVDGVATRLTDRDAAGKLTNTRLFIARSALPPPEPEEWYLADLIGLAAVDPAGTHIGTIAVVHDYGAGASLEIERRAGGPLLIPFTSACVPIVDTVTARVVVVVPNEAVVAEDAEPVVREDAEPLVREDAEPVLPEEAESVVRKEAEPAVQEDAGSVLPQDAKPAVPGHVERPVPAGAKTLVRADPDLRFIPQAREPAS